jgi:UDP-glucose 4-epimerase
MVQKSPACTIGDLAQAVKELFNSNMPINYIGIRHGEKRSETLLTKEECMHADDLGNFYRVPADNRDLNYEQYFEQGKSALVKLEEFTSDNTTRLNVAQIKEKLLTTDYIRSELAI